MLYSSSWRRSKPPWILEPSLTWHTLLSTPVPSHRTAPDPSSNYTKAICGTKGASRTGASRIEETDNMTIIPFSRQVTKNEANQQPFSPYDGNRKREKIVKMNHPGGSAPVPAFAILTSITEMHLVGIEHRPSRYHPPSCFSEQRRSLPTQLRRYMVLQLALWLVGKLVVGIAYI